MNEVIREHVIKELECICDKCIQGDPTVIVFDILKQSSDMHGLCQYLGLTIKSTENKKNNTRPQLSMFDQMLAAGIKWSE